jgi:hypothetical protein
LLVDKNEEERIVRENMNRWKFIINSSSLQTLTHEPIVLQTVNDEYIILIIDNNQFKILYATARGITYDVIIRGAIHVRFIPDLSSFNINYPLTMRLLVLPGKQLIDSSRIFYRMNDFILQSAWQEATLAEIFDKLRTQNPQIQVPSIESNFLIINNVQAPFIPFNQIEQLFNQGNVSNYIFDPRLDQYTKSPNKILVIITKDGHIYVSKVYPDVATGKIFPEV